MTLPFFKQNILFAKIERLKLVIGTLNQVQVKQHYVFNVCLLSIKRFHSRDQRPYWFYKTKENRVQFSEGLPGTPIWPPFLCFGTSTWPPWRHVKTLSIFLIFNHVTKRPCWCPIQCNFFIKIKFSSQRRDRLLFLGTMAWPPWRHTQTSNVLQCLP